MSEPRARVVEVDGELLLIDPDAVAVANAVGKHNCKATLMANRDRIRHFEQRVVDKDLIPDDVVIVVINVDDRYGALAEVLMPGHNWQEYRDLGQIPYARGLAVRRGIQDFLDEVDVESAAKLRGSSGVAIMVADHGVTEVFSTEDLR